MIAEWVSWVKYAQDTTKLVKVYNSDKWHVYNASHQPPPDNEQFHQVVIDIGSIETIETDCR